MIGRSARLRRQEVIEEDDPLRSRRIQRVPRGIAWNILEVMSRISMRTPEDVPYTIEEEVRLRPRRWIPSMIDVQSLVPLIDDRYPTTYEESTDLINGQGLRTVRIEGQDDVKIYKYRLGVDDTLKHDGWDLRVTRSIEYTPTEVEHYTELGLDMEDDSVTLTRKKQRLIVDVGICQLMITQVIQSDRRPEVEFEMEIPSMKIEEDRVIEYTDGERQDCIDECLKIADKILEVIREVQDKITSWLPDDRGREWLGSFFGSLPVSYRNRHIEQLLTHRYFIQVKLDGVRYIMINHRRRLWYLSRSHGLILSQQQAHPTESYMIDVEIQNGISMAFDMLALGSRSLMNLPYSSRYNSLKDFVYSLPGDIQEFLDVNPTLPLRDITDLTDNIDVDTKIYRVGELEFATDGLIFQHDGPYRQGRDDFVFKWKFPDLLSIDFEKVIGGLAVSTERGLSKMVEDSSIVPGGIAEYVYDKRTSRWTSIGERPDKTDPNFITTAMDAIESMIEDVSFDELLNEILQGLGEE